MMNIETDLKKIRKAAKEKEDENWKFRTFLRTCDISPEKIDSIVHKLYQQTSSEIDCKSCGNCCREIQPVLDQEDIEKFSKYCGISTSQFKGQYLVKDDEPEGYIFNEKPCPFFKKNLCIYPDCRPKDCISYPHLHKKDFVLRLIDVIHNYSICPIVFNVYEHLKDEIWHDQNFKNLENFNLIDIEVDDENEWN